MNQNKVDTTFKAQLVNLGSDFNILFTIFYIRCNYSNEKKEHDNSSTQNSVKPFVTNHNQVDCRNSWTSNFIMTDKSATVHQHLAQLL